MEINVAQSPTENLSDDAQRLALKLTDPVLLAAELDLTRRRVTALIGELAIHLDRENDLQEQATRRRAYYATTLEQVEAQRETERWFAHQSFIASAMLGLSGWVAFIGLLAFELSH